MSSDGLIIGLNPNEGAAAGSPAGAAAGTIKDTTTADFVADVIEASRSTPILVDFWAPWCGPCKQLTPILEKTVARAGGAVHLVKLNIDDHPEIPGQLGIRSIPAVIAFKNGQPLDGFSGAVPESQVMAFIERVAGPIGPSDTEKSLEAAAAALAANDYAGAAGLFATVLQAEPENLTALGGMADCQIALGNLDQARALLAGISDTLANDPAILKAKAALDLAEQAAALGDPEAMRQALTTNPDDHQTRFDLALALNASGDRQGATDQLLEIVRRDRDWNEEAARAQLLQFFESWGLGDPASQSGRQRLSSLLFA